MALHPGDYASGLYLSNLVVSAIGVIYSMPHHVSYAHGPSSFCYASAVDPVGREGIFFVSINISASLGLSVY